MDWAKYRTTTFDELIQADGQPRPAARRLVEYLGGLSGREIAERQLAADVIARVMGITFTVYSDGRNVDRTLPFDLIPRVIPLTEWTRTEAGLKQRMRALNLFIGDIYGRQQIVKDKVFPAMLLKDSVNFREQCVGMQPPLGVWAHICGSDLVRDGDGTLYALEDNLRIPSGVSYMLENRMVAKRVFPELFETSSILPVDDYPSQLYDTLAALSPRPGDTPVIALLTPGVFNSAYFEHAYLAQAMGIELVEGNDLFVADDDCTYMRTVYGPRRVDVIYRRVDDLFIDPEVFHPDSVLGAPG
ncbi:MAG: circularly permuted type 2 ATP-grasp protein, partial [Pseudoxanthomonas sp.]